MGSGPANSESSTEQKGLQQQQLGILKEQGTTNKALEPLYMAQLGLKKNADGTYGKMSEDERLASMTSDEKSAYQTRMLISNRLKGALEGTTVSQSLESALGAQDADWQAYLSRKLGQDWKNTTAGKQSLSELGEQSNILRDTVARNEIGNSTGLLMNAQEQNWNDISSKMSGYQNYANRDMALFEALGEAQQPYEKYKQLQFQHNVGKSQQKTANIGAGVGAVASVAAIAIAI